MPASNPGPAPPIDDPSRRHELWWTSPGVAEIRAVGEDDGRNDQPSGSTRVLTTRCTGLSHGTERLVAYGKVPESLWTSMRCPHQRGHFGFPVCYGYSLVGRDREGVRWHALHPHSTHAVVDEAWLTALPDDVPDERATLLPNVETALNAVWAGEVQPGDRCAVIGAGVVGQAIAKIARMASGVLVTVVEPVESKRRVAIRLGNEAYDPHELEARADQTFDYDVVFHTSATEQGLRTALSLAGDDGAIVEVSWFGDDAPALPLGAAFHYRRLRLVSAQVAEVPPNRRARWTTRRRREHAMSLLRDDAWDALIDDRVPFASAPVWLAANLSGAESLHTVFLFALAGDPTTSSEG